ncbi:MAG: DUF1697 domain-containing protein [Bacteroidetes bacterium]|jgi:uncharacterized protein (DUF1697 family)|nr:DUF1697 domain-containing protein [Bacteroidota bacterium]
MPTYITLLRGINVSGKNKIKMADLRRSLSGLGYTGLQTYIQSGNIVFDAEAQDTGAVETAIAQCIQEDFGYEVPVLALTAQELEEIAAQNPFSEEAEADGRRMLLTLLNAPPAAGTVEQLDAKEYGSERYVVQGRVVYLHCPEGYGRAKLNNNFLERKLQVPATTRNWKTVVKLLELAGR